MKYLRLLLVFAIAMCADKILAMEHSKTSTRRFPPKELTPQEQYQECIDQIRSVAGPVFNFLNFNPWVDGICWCLYNIAPKIGGGREKNNWGWEGYWGKGVYGFMVFPDVYKSKWLKVGFLDVKYNFIGRTVLLLRTISSYDKEVYDKKVVGKEGYRSAVFSSLKCLVSPRFSFVCFNFFGFFFVFLFSPHSIDHWGNAFAKTLNFFVPINFVLKNIFLSGKALFWNLNFQIDFNEFFKFFEKEESEPQF